jgi:hypothetical protein
LAPVPFLYATYNMSSWDKTSPTPAAASETPGIICSSAQYTHLPPADAAITWNCGARIWAENTVYFFPFTVPVISFVIWGIGNLPRIGYDIQGGFTFFYIWGEDILLATDIEAVWNIAISTNVLYCRTRSGFNVWFLPLPNHLTYILSARVVLAASKKFFPEKVIIDLSCRCFLHFHFRLFLLTSFIFHMFHVIFHCLK